MRFHSRIGILPHERELPQPLEVDVTVWRSTLPPGSGDVLDYRALYDVAADAALPGAAYLEEVADTIAERLLGLPSVERTRVAVRKPHVALPGPLACAEVVVERDRRD